MRLASKGNLLNVDIPSSFPERRVKKDLRKSPKIGLREGNWTEGKEGRVIMGGGNMMKVIVSGGEMKIEKTFAQRERIELPCQGRREKFPSTSNTGGKKNTRQGK